MKSPLILVSSDIKTYSTNGSQSYPATRPRRDYIEIGRRLAGTLVGYDLFDGDWYEKVRRLETALKLDVVEAMFSVSQNSKHNVFVSTSEKAAIPLSVMRLIASQKTPHIAIVHKLSSISKRLFFKMWPIEKSFGHIICICRTQADYAVQQLGMAPSKVDFIFHNVDHLFFRPFNSDSDDYILAVGQEQRDYETLLRALSGTGIRLIIVASSPWSTNGTGISAAENVTTLSNIAYSELRSLYAGARLVVVPLFDVDYAAGSTTLLEAMAMGKPVIVSRSRGISDYIADNETGLYVSPQNSTQLRETILSLWSRAATRNQLGTNARRAIEECMNIDIYADRVSEIVEQCITTA